MYFFTVFVCLLLLLLLSSAKIIILFHRLYEDDNILIKVVLLFGLVKLKFKIPYMDMFFKDGMKPGAEIISKGSKEIERFLDMIKDKLIKISLLNKKYRKIFKHLISKLNFDAIKWHTEIGLEDAALTAISAGLLYTIKSNIINILHNVNHDNVEYKVSPNFSTPIFEVNLHCIIRVKIANIIIAGSKIFYIFMLDKIYKKGGELNERASYPGTDENYNG